MLYVTLTKEKREMYLTSLFLTIVCLGFRWYKNLNSFRMKYFFSFFFTLIRVCCLQSKDSWKFTCDIQATFTSTSVTKLTWITKKKRCFIFLFWKHNAFEIVLLCKLYRNVCSNFDAVKPLDWFLWENKRYLRVSNTCELSLMFSISNFVSSLNLNSLQTTCIYFSSFLICN